ncbi:SGNH/GDSL hydrolase family protein [Rhizobium sp. S-51]|uniref:SGNH/GDSL hydrolase family protein n=1 Tax=Rhizobium terricola TaxID=2728849 RepID=A0A7Y0FUU0_9HYPH|nr:SGNH/GDSL hydrolase family protein [Rhizobium terricola]NML73081.1 SGNH/GDSL hydrolase family protein [Rhizobium terricola]
MTVDRSSRNWPFIMEKKLQIGRSVRVRTITTGREGQASGWGLANIGPIADVRPDMTIIGFINDANPVQLTISQAESNYRAMIAAVRAKAPASVIYLATFSQVMPAARTSPFSNLTALDSMLPNVASSEGVGFINVRGAWGDPTAHADEFTEADPIHCLLSGHLRVTVPVVSAAVAALLDA